MQGRIGNKNVHEKISRHQPVDLNAGGADIIETHVTLHHDERADLLLRHQKNGPSQLIH